MNGLPIFIKLVPAAVAAVPMLIGACESVPMFIAPVPVLTALPIFNVVAVVFPIDIVSAAATSIDGVKVVSFIVIGQVDEPNERLVVEALPPTVNDPVASNVGDTTVPENVIGLPLIFRGPPPPRLIFAAFEVFVPILITPFIAPNTDLTPVPILRVPNVCKSAIFKSAVAAFAQLKMKC